MSPARLTIMLRRMTYALTVGAGLATAACGLDVGVEYPNGVYDTGYPPDAYIATTEPVDFDGHASYWYGGRWYYRNGGGWGHYDKEPAALRQRRTQAAPARRTYERSGGHPAGRAGGRAAGGSRGHR